VEYYHVVFTLPAPVAEIAYQNKAVVYGLLFDVAVGAGLNLFSFCRSERACSC
jgi:hypothetical protein